MNTNKVNSYGLFDAPTILSDKERIVFAPQDIEAQLNQGAFFMCREDAEKAGFLNPDDDSEVVVADVRGDL